MCVIVIFGCWLRYCQNYSSSWHIWLTVECCARNQQWLAKVPAVLTHTICMATALIIQEDLQLLQQPVSCAGLPICIHIIIHCYDVLLSYHFSITCSICIHLLIFFSHRIEGSVILQSNASFALFSSQSFLHCQSYYFFITNCCLLLHFIQH